MTPAGIFKGKYGRPSSLWKIDLCNLPVARVIPYHRLTAPHNLLLIRLQRLVAYQRLILLTKHPVLFDVVQGFLQGTWAASSCPIPVDADISPAAATSSACACRSFNETLHLGLTSCFRRPMNYGSYMDLPLFYHY